MDNLISIIVPVYNSEKYLCRCIKSIQGQTYHRFEVLLMDDGSSDGSRDICESICERDSHFLFFSLAHRGVSCARNEGMRRARGKYLFFLDSDDEMHPRLLETLHFLVEKNHSAMAGVGYLMTDEIVEGKTENRETGNEAIHYTCLKSEEALECFPFEMRDYFFFSIGGKLILREAVGTLIFDVDLQNAEDTLFLYQVLCNGADIVVLHERWYYYRKHGDGASEACSVKAYRNRYEVCRYICEQEKEKGRIINAIHWNDFMIRFILSLCLRYYGMGQEDLDRYFSQIMREQQDEELFSYVRCSTRVRLYLARLYFPIYRRLFLLALIFVERQNKAAELLPHKYMEQQIEEYIRP